MSPAPVTERRLGVFLSHLRPCAPPAERPRRGRHHHHEPQVQEAEAQTAGVSASPCAADGKGETSGGEHCVFCEIVKGNKPAYKLYEDDVCLCILDIKPLSTGTGGEDPLKFPLCDVTFCINSHGNNQAFTDHSKKSFSITTGNTTIYAFNVLVNNGKVAGQVIFHTHVHIIPRKKGDNLWSSETYERNPIKHNQETKDLVSSIKELLFSPDEDDSAEGSTIPKEL